MKKYRLPLVFASVFVLILGASFGGFYYLNSRKAAATDVVVVELLADRASPSLVAVKLDQYVQFNTKDGQVHNIGQGKGEGPDRAKDVEASTKGHNESTPHAATDPKDGLPHDHQKGSIESGDFKPDEGYRVKFSKAGTYEFHDHYNPKINITVVVYDQDKK